MARNKVISAVVSCQAKDANPLQKALANKMGNYQLLEDEAGPGALQNVVEVAPFLKVRAGAECEPDRTASGLDRTTVRINYACVEVFDIRKGLLHGCVDCPLHARYHWQSVLTLPFRQCTGVQRVLQ